MTLPLCTNLLVTHCLLFHSRSTKEMLIPHSGCYCLRKHGFVYFPFCRTRNLLRLPKCVTTSTNLQGMKSSVSRHISNEWAIMGRTMSIWLYQVCFLIFPLCKGNLSESPLSWPLSCWLVCTILLVINLFIHLSSL